MPPRRIPPPPPPPPPPPRGPPPPCPPAPPAPPAPAAPPPPPAPPAGGPPAPRPPACPPELSPAIIWARKGGSSCILQSALACTTICCFVVKFLTVRVLACVSTERTVAPILWKVPKTTLSAA